MYVRTTRQRRQHGPDAIDDQLAEHYYHQERRGADTRVIYTFGRADQGDPEAWRRLAQSILRVAHEDRIELPARQCPPDGGLDDIEPVQRYGVRQAAHALGEERGLGPRLRAQREPDGCPAPHATALCAMTANRRARPASTLACDAHGRADDGYWPDAQGLALAHRQRALDCLRHHSDAREPELCVRTAELCNADGDLVFWDTTRRSCELDAEDEAGEDWPGRPIPARRTRGQNPEGRDGTPPVVVGLALTRAGRPVRSWVFPGPSAAVTTIDHRKDDGRGWRVHRCVWGGERGMFSAAHRQRRGRALGRYILAVPRRQGTAGHQEVLSRPGRYRDGAAHRRVQDGWGGEGARRRRDVVGHHPDEAAREQAPRARLLELVRAERAPLDARQADPPKNAGELTASRRCGRSLRLEARGRLRIHATKVAAEAQDEGTCVVTTTDDTRDAEDGARGQTSRRRSAGGFRRLKTTGLQTRPLDHGRPPRLIAQVKLWVWALRLERAAEIRCQQPWRTMRQTLDPLQGVRYRMHGKTMGPSTQGTSTMAQILPSLGMPLPTRMLEVSDEAHASSLPQIHASKSPCVSQ